MADPWDDFAARIDAPEGTNIYPAMAQVPVMPAIIIVPAEPWMQTNGYQYDTERYWAVCADSASAPADAASNIHRMVHAVREAGGEGFEVRDVSAIRAMNLPDDGSNYLAAWVEFTYRNCEHEVTEGS